MKLAKYCVGLFLAGFALGATPSQAEISVAKVSGDLSKVPLKDDVFAGAKAATISLTAQPMVVPRPKTVTTSDVAVKAVHNGEWIAFQLKWKDKERSTTGKLGKFSDAVAVQFPVKDNANPPAVFMGAKDDPVHIFHWRAQYQDDKNNGAPDIKKIYPNMNIDTYPMEFPDMGTIEKVDDSQREVYSAGRAAGNPQSYIKKGVDEIIAEGYGTSSVIENVLAEADGRWENGQWTVVITRPLKRPDGSVLEAGKDSNVAFAVWQGGADEVGSRKSVTMMWTPLKIAQ